MGAENKDDRLYRDDILRAKKAALKKRNSDLLSDSVKTEATVRRVMQGENVQVMTLQSIANDLRIPMHELFIFEDDIAIAG